MADILEDSDIREWPSEVEDKYERYEALGKGSFGVVWMCRRLGKPTDQEDDEYVAIKEINIKDEKSEIYAQREIEILKELKHPNVIRMIRAHPVFNGARVVVMQLARGPNLHQLVIKRGALGLPLVRLISRQLIAAVSYLHGRAVIHRDIKPSNCILACNAKKPHHEYDWTRDDAIWSSKDDCEKAVNEGRWKLMLVDFGFARALEHQEIDSQTRRMRNSIRFESSNSGASAGASSSGLRKSVMPTEAQPAAIPEADEGSEFSDDAAALQLLDSTVNNLRQAFEPTNEAEDAIMGSGSMRERLSGVSMPLEESGDGPDRKERMSHARSNVRSMSALGTKAYAAPEIRKQLRHKTDEDFEKENAAMTECVADYGMIVDAYSVGWTLRVAITGVPPNFTISEYMKERESVILEDEEEEPPPSGCCGCFAPKPNLSVKVREPSKIPPGATYLITKMVEKKPEDRMTVREAQTHPYICGNANENYRLPEGDFPSKHGDPVVPLTCAPELSKLTVQYHMT